MRMMRVMSAALIGLFGWNAALGAEQPPVKTAAATYQTVEREQMFNAVIEAVNQSTVSAQTSGRVVEINFDVDDYVEKDSVLLRIRDAEQQAAAEAAQARFNEAQSEFQRARDLLQQDLIPQSQYDRAEAALKSARAALEQAREQLERTVVRAPYAGIVVERHIEVGETANPGQPLMTGLSLEQLRAVASVPQAHIGQIRALKKARVILPTVHKSLPAAGLTISPFADPQSHTFQVRVNMPDGQHGVYPGMFAKAAFVVGEQRSLLIPAKSVVYRSEVTAAYVVDEANNTVSFRQIRVGQAHEGQIEVLAGLSEGEKVAVDPIRAGVWLKEKRSGGSDE